MPRAKDGHQKRAGADEHPFKDDVRAFGGEREQKREADSEIKEPPQHIDQRRGFADARWRRKRGLEPGAAGSLNEVLDAVGQKQSSDELQQKDIPGNAEHMRPPSLAALSA